MYYLSADFETYLIFEKGKYYHVPYLFAFTNGKTFVTIKKKDYANIQQFYKQIFLELFQELKKNKIPKMFVYFHNLSSFDGLLFMKYLYSESEKANFIVRNSSIYEIKVYDGKKTERKVNRIIFRDSYHHLPYSLAKLCNMLNTSTQKQNILHNGREDYSDKMIKYLISDVYSLYQCLEKYDELLKEFFKMSLVDSMTMPSLSLKYFINEFFLPEYNTWKELPLDVEENIKLAYLGGIVDVYKPYGTDLVVLDINSLYPYVMQKYKYGVSFPRIFIGKNQSEYYSLIHENECFIWVDVSCKELYQPLLAVKHNSKLIQPEGEFSGLFTSQEIRYCLKNYPHHYKFDFKWASVYPQQENIFKDFISKLYQVRKQLKANKDPREALVKRMMNSFYGRLGLKDEGTKTQLFTLDQWEKFINKESNEDKVRIANEVGSTVIAELFSDYGLLKSKILKSRVDWAAQITSWARITMQEIKDKVDVYYTDTDSIVIKKSQINKIQSMIGDDIGQLKLESECDEAVFLSAKAYALRKGDHYTIKIKGAAAKDFEGAEKDLFELMKNKLRANSNTIKFTKDFVMKKNIREGTLEHIYNVDKEYSMIYEKRKKIYTDDLWTGTRPLFLK